MQTLVDLFHSFAARGDKPALVDRTGVRRFVTSYRELSELSLRMSSLLAQKGVQPGDRVLLWGPNSSWWAVAYWGIIMRGAVAVPVDFMSDRGRADSIRKLTQSRILLQSRFKAERIDGEDSLFLEDLRYLLEEVAPAPDAVNPAPDDMAQLIYTSGTTGNPKGVILTHKNLAANVLQIHQQVPIITPEFSFLSLLPLSHMFEQMGGFFLPLYRGGTVIYPRTLKPSAIMEALSEEDIYVIMSVPRLMQLLKSTIERELAEKHLDGLFARLSRLAQGLSKPMRKLLFFPVQRKFGSNFTVFVSGGAPLDPELFRFWDSMGFTLLEGYGLTECSPVLCVNTMEKQVAGSVGPPLPGVELRLDGKELVVHGDNVTPGYYQNEQATRDAFTADGWFRTGDLCEISPDGWLSIKGREKELIVTGGGVNVYPDELEAVLNKISGVKESCVIGLDRGGGEEVHAVLLLDDAAPAPEQILGQANAQLDTMHQITGYTIWGEPEFPKTTTLKIKKFQVKEQLKQGTAAGGAGGGDHLTNLLAKVTGADASKITEQSLLVADLGLTSIARLELVNFLEQEYRLDIEDSQIGPETRVEELRKIISRREKGSHRGHFRFWTNSAPIRALRMAGDALINYPLFRLFVKLDVHGAKRLEGVQGPVIFVSNHLGYFDQPSLMFSLPRRMRYRTATAAWQEFFFGDYHGVDRVWRYLCYQYGTLFLNLFPLPQTSGFSGAVKFMGKLTDNGFNTLIFPEGAHSLDGRMGDFQLGLGIIAKELGISIVPVRISGTDKVLPPKHAGIPNRGTVTVSFGEPLHFRFEEPAEIVAKAQAAVAAL